MENGAGRRIRGLAYKLAGVRNISSQLLNGFSEIWSKETMYIISGFLCMNLIYYIIAAKVRKLKEEESG